jgi:hypothetical protein
MMSPQLLSFQKTNKSVEQSNRPQQFVQERKMSKSENKETRKKQHSKNAKIMT